MARFFVVEFDEPGVLAKGKGSRNIIVRLTRVMGKLGVPSEVLPFADLMARGAIDDPQSYVLLHYNELFVVQNEKVDWLRARESEIEALGHRILHSVEHGRVVGHKIRQNKVLTAAGVPMPRLIETGFRLNLRSRTKFRTLMFRFSLSGMPQSWTRIVTTPSMSIVVTSMKVRCGTSAFVRKRWANRFCFLGLERGRSQTFELVEHPSTPSS